MTNVTLIVGSLSKRVAEPRRGSAVVRQRDMSFNGAIDHRLEGFIRSPGAHANHGRRLFASQAANQIGEDIRPGIATKIGEDGVIYWR